jgi:hypothetical protein
MSFGFSPCPDHHFQSLGFPRADEKMNRGDLVVEGERWMIFDKGYQMVGQISQVLPQQKRLDGELTEEAS